MNICLSSPLLSGVVYGWSLVKAALLKFKDLNADFKVLFVYENL
jgi:hypothetical protein